MSIIREDWEIILDKGPNQVLGNALRVIIPSSMADHHTRTLAYVPTLDTLRAEPAGCQPQYLE